jgi:large conductance mechanosensitive channel
MALERLSGLDPRKQAFSLFGEFKAFAFKGNVIDLAVGVIIGAAFGGLVKSLVDNIIMPLVASIGGSPKGVEALAFKIGETPVPYGKFLGDVLNFLILAAVLFVFIVKFLGWVMRAKKQEAAAPPPPTKDQELLTEIRDLLAKRPAV